MKIEQIKELADPHAIVWDGFDNAIIGIDTDGKIVYDTDKMESILVNRDNMTKEEAIEYLQFNVYCNYASEDLNPIHVTILNNK
jgi:hypothetical protein